MQSIVLIIILIFPFISNSLHQKDLRVSPNLSPDPPSIFIVATIDGSLHAINSSSGKHVWTLNCFNSSMVKTSYEPWGLKEKKEKKEWQEEEESKLEEIYIPEPNNGGSLYLYSPGKPIEVIKSSFSCIFLFQNSDSFSLLKKLSFSIKELVHMAPFRNPDGLIYLGKKTTSYVSVNLRNGLILDSQNLGKANDNFLFETMNNSDMDTLQIVRTDYFLSIYNTGLMKSSWNISYSEYSIPPDDIFFENKKESFETFKQDLGLFATSDGRLLFKDLNLDEVVWSTEFRHTVIAVYNVEPTKDMLLHKRNDYHLQKTTLFFVSYHKAQYNFPGVGQAYIGLFNGGLYALGTENSLTTVDLGFTPISTNSEGLPDISSSKDLAVYSQPVISQICHENKNELFRYLVGEHLVVMTSVELIDSGQSEDIPKKKKRKLIIGTLLSGLLISTLLLWRLFNNIRRSPNGSKKEKKKRKLEKPSSSIKQIKQKEFEEKAAILLCNSKITNIFNNLAVSDEVLGYGSHGTVVFKGVYGSRLVAVKRLLLDFYDVAHQEVKLLQESDHHPNVIRYFCQEISDRFLFIALELCPVSLYDFIEKGPIEELSQLFLKFETSSALYGILSGLSFLHDMNIVHRDIKPQNILICVDHISNKKDDYQLRLVISDFGLCKKLDIDETSYVNTMTSGSGTVGWRAPEAIGKALSTRSNSSIDEGDTAPRFKASKAVDIFSAGILFYYVLTGGEHPFGDYLSREINIIEGRYSLDGLDILPATESYESKRIITKMLSMHPQERPKVKQLLCHPFFWDATKRLHFLLEISDRFEIEDRDPPSELLITLENLGPTILGERDWSKSIDRALLFNMGKYRKYNGKSVRDLLRLIRNKKHHYLDLPPNLKKIMGDIPTGFLKYFTDRFPCLLIEIYECILETHLVQEEVFSNYFEFTLN